MSQGRIGRSVRRYPDARRRISRYGGTRYGQQGRGLPPNLMPGISRPKKGSPVFSRRNFIIGFFGLAFVTIMTFLAITTVSAVAGVAGTIRAYRKVNKDLPNAAEIAVDTFQTTRIFDRKGTLLQEVDNPDYGWRTFVPLDQVSPFIIDATVAAEDSTFWNNYGVEPFAIIRGGLINLSGTGSSGGSTITQQLVRAVFPDQISALDSSYTRKFREALAAIALAQEYSKEDILTMYVNQIYYGARSYGIEAASQTFFNKHAAEVTLAEAALLAGLPQAPSAYDPTTPDGFELAKRRQRYVLDQMRRYHYITHEEAEAAWNEPLQIQEDPRSSVLRAAPHFTEYVRGHVYASYGEEALYGGLDVYTSIDLDLQAAAEEVVAQGMGLLEQYQRNNAAMVVMNPATGEVLAMIGSADFNNASIAGQVNYATSLIQPGSSMKPIAYSAAFEKGWHPATVVMDIPTQWEVIDQEPYAPNNYSMMFYGAVDVRTALANSLNISAVKATEYATVEGVMDMARRMGIVDSLEEDAGFYGLSIGLGAGEVQLLEHTNAYATLANNGKFVPAHPIREIRDSQGNKLYELNKEQIEKDTVQAMNPGNAYQVTSILTDNDSREMVFTTDNLFGNTQSALGRPTAAKSGTTEEWRDLWTMGYTTDVAVGVWVGRSGDAGTAQLPEVDGIQTAGPIWQDMMMTIHDTAQFTALLVGPDGNPPPKEFPQPDEAFRGELCAPTGHKPTSGDTVRDWLVRGQEPTLACGDLDEREQKELDAALSAVRKGNVRWASGAVDRINRYARAAGERGVPAEDEDEDRDSSNNSNSNDNDENSNDSNEEQPPIEPID
jgi:membrane peptidoglycan carboxypeptidase